jgi:hypothetical protein
VLGGAFELAADEDWSEPEELDDAPLGGVGLDWPDEAIDEDDGEPGAPGELDDGLDCDMLDELGGVVADVEVLWRSLHATAKIAEAMAMDNTEAFICFSFLENATKRREDPASEPPSFDHRTDRARRRPSVRSRRDCRKLPDAAA